MSPFDSTFERFLHALEADRVMPRLWEHDHTLWRPEPTEIADRLGWLEVPTAMRSHLTALETLAQDADEAGVRDVVLLGMGGSSLGAEALYRIVADPDGLRRLHVLDSTVPGWVAAVRGAIDPASTWFVVASKSGTTAEVQALFERFWADAAAAVADPGRQFVAITDPATPLSALAVERGFRALFENPPDIGGRFSVLSLFGLVTAALVGIEPARLLQRAEAAMADCGPLRPVGDNPAARLGAFAAAGAATGRPLLTLLTTPRLATFGLWAEQLLAESTGKEGKGVLPIAGEPEAEPARYGADRAFVALELHGDGEAAVAERADALAGAGQPVLRLTLSDPYDLGYQLFVWEAATAVAGHLLGIHPFDQPDVQAAKTSTNRILAAFEATGRLPADEADGDLAAALEDRPTYVALLAYLSPSDRLEASVDRLRAAILRRHGIATSFGYGPRYLHSTGQLHKGGFPGGLHVLLAADDPRDVEIPGRGYGFRTLAAAQQAGDLEALSAAGRQALRWTVSPDGGELATLAARLLGT